MDQIASAIIEINSWSPSQARNAYSAVLLLPGFYHLRFHNLLLPFKKLWNASTEKYGGFWDCTPVVLAYLAPLASDQSLDSSSLDSHCSLHSLETMTLKHLRERMIMICRLFNLFRSADLANLQRSASIQGSIPCMKVRRKGWKFHKWERLVSIPEFPRISPWHLIREYVRRTAKQGKPGGPLILTLKKPFRALSVQSRLSQHIS